MNEHGMTKLLLTLASDDPDQLERAAGTTMPGPSCPPVPRFRSALLREDWTESEERHKRGCPYCQGEDARARREAWHPTVGELFQHARDLSSNADLAHHLRRDSCRRCHRLVTLFQADRLLGRLASQVRQGLAGAADRLGQMLASVATSSFLPSLSPPSEQRLAFEGASCSAILFHTSPPRLRLELFDDRGDRPRLLRLLLGAGKDLTERFVVPHSSKESEKRTAEVRLDRLPSEPAMLALYEVDAAALDRDDTPALREGWMAAGKSEPAAVTAWRCWAADTLKTSGLEGGLRRELKTIARPDSSAPPPR